MKLSVVSPIYQAEDLLDELIERIIAQVSGVTFQFEIILVEDGSTDGSWKGIEKHCLKDNRIKGIQLSRNFGQHSAIAAGIKNATGEWVVVMDCDLQDRPEEIPALYHKAQEGYDVVLARRTQRKDSKYAQFSSKLFYHGLSFLSGIKYDSAIANFGIYHQRVLRPMMQIHNSILYFPAMGNWVGFNQTSIPVTHTKRANGKSSYHFAKKCNLAINILLIYSDTLLKVLVGFGLLTSFVALAIAIFSRNLPVVIAFFSGMIISTLGILGLHMSKLFETTKSKPSYLIRTKINA